METFTYKKIKTKGNISKLVFFLHGYTSNIDDVYPYTETLAQYLRNTLIVIPQSDMESERREGKKQWYALQDLDPDKKRRQPDTSIAEIVEIYNKTGQRISAMARRINRFITQIQREYHVSNKNTYIMGFSQGAMLAIYAGLTRRYSLGGIFPFAGIVCGKDLLEQEILSRPEVHLFHGTEDLSVQYKTLEFTKEWLEKHNISWEALEYDGIEHKLTKDEMLDAAEIINRDRG